MYEGELSQSQGITYTSIIDPLRLPPLCFPRYLGTGDALHRAGRAAPAEPKFVEVTRSRLKQRSDAPHPLLLPDPGKAGPPRGHSPLPAGICPGGVTSLQPAPSATPAKPRRPDPGEAAGESPAESSPAAPGLPLPAQPGGCRSQAAGSRFPPRTAPRRGALEPLPHTRGSCDPEQEAGGEGKEEKEETFWAK